MRTSGILAIVVVLACGRRDESPHAGSTGSSAHGVDARMPPAVAPADGAIVHGRSLAGREPPSSESVHVELEQAMERWKANPRDPSLYATDFTGIEATRYAREADPSKGKPIGREDWLARPAGPARTGRQRVVTWLDRQFDLETGESKVEVQVYRSDDFVEYRVLRWRREGSRQRLLHDELDSTLEGRDLAADLGGSVTSTPGTLLDGSFLGTRLHARFASEGRLTWLVLENAKGEQVVGELTRGRSCTPLDMPDGQLPRLRCTDGHTVEQVFIEMDDDPRPIAAIRLVVYRVIDGTTDMTARTKVLLFSLAPGTRVSKGGGSPP